MANIKISDLTSAASVSGTQQFEVNESGTSKKVTGAQIAAYVEGEVSSSPTFTGQVSNATGSAASPSISVTGDTNTGVYFPAADTIGLSTGGTLRVSVNSSGSLVTTGDIELGHASDTTLSRLSAGVIAVEGKALATLLSPIFTGTPTAPTAAVDTNSLQLATTAYVVGQGYAKLASPALTGTPTAPTATADTNTQQLATTAYVIGQGYLKSSTASATYQAALGFTPVQQGGGTSQLTNKLYMGWSGSDLRLQIDSTDFGSTWPINISGSASGGGSAFLGSATTSGGSTITIPSLNLSSYKLLFVYLISVDPTSNPSTAAQISLGGVQLGSGTGGISNLAIIDLTSGQLSSTSGNNGNCSVTTSSTSVSISSTATFQSGSIRLIGVK